MGLRRPLALLVFAAQGVIAQTAPLLAPLTAELAGQGATPSPWRLALLPGQTLPRTEFSVATIDGQPALRIDARASYGWDRLLPAGSELRNAYTRRVRYVVLQGPTTPLGAWRSERRDLRADFQRAFGDEAREVPPLVAIVIGADADNTKSESRAYLSDLNLILR